MLIFKNISASFLHGQFLSLSIKITLKPRFVIDLINIFWETPPPRKITHSFSFLTFTYPNRPCSHSSF